ncbi:hypothetical protein TA3x_005406 [Tundrisphaera sp. TA3]|uniref:hypothetical protein n=1 Tax=Tundrisphaera sp. TA3 TaxID=3435775 RepID=UPI003EB9F4CE
MPSRVGAVLLGTVAVIVAGSMPGLAQEPAGAKPATPAAKKKGDPSRRVPDYFGQIGLTPEQRTSIYGVQDKHMGKIEALEKQIEAVRAEMLAECENVLDETQKKLLANLRRAAARPAEAAKAPK